LALGQVFPVVRDPAVQCLQLLLEAAPVQLLMLPLLDAGLGLPLSEDGPFQGIRSVADSPAQPAGDAERHIGVALCQ
jgi:hypothetical protein